MYRKGNEAVKDVEIMFTVWYLDSVRPTPDTILQDLNAMKWPQPPRERIHQVAPDKIEFSWITPNAGPLAKHLRSKIRGWTGAVKELKLSIQRIHMEIMNTFEGDFPKHSSPYRLPASEKYRTSHSRPLKRVRGRSKSVDSIASSVPEASPRPTTPQTRTDLPDGGQTGLSVSVKTPRSPEKPSTLSDPAVPKPSPAIPGLVRPPSTGVTPRLHGPSPLNRQSVQHTIPGDFQHSMIIDEPTRTSEAPKEAGKPLSYGEASDIQHLTNGLNELRKHLTEMSLKETALLQQLDSLNASDVPKPVGNLNLRVESELQDRLMKLQETVQQERNLRNEAEHFILAVQKEGREPFVASALVEAFIEISRLTGRVDKTEI